MSVAVAEVTLATQPAWIGLLRAIEAEVRPHDPTAATQAESGVRASLKQFDFTQSDSCWIVLAEVSGSPAGYAAAVRIPKADARTGFVFVDELYVLHAYRRSGVATALLKYIEQVVRVVCAPHFLSHIV